MSDQQLVTGIAIMVTIYTKSCDISIYSFQIAAALAWFSSTTHLATLTLLRAYFDHHRVARNFRAVMMVMMMIMLAAAQIISNSESVQHSSTDIYFGCALKKSFKLSPINGYEITNLVLIIAWLIQSYSSRMVAIYSAHTKSSYSWLTRKIASTFRLELDEPTAEDDSLRRLDEVMQAVDGRLCDGPLRQWPLLRRFCVWYTYFFALAGAVERAFTNSFLWQLIRLLFGASFGIGQVISIRKDYPVAYRRDQETETLNKWGFGQILPLIFLAHPILTGLEAYFGKRLTSASKVPRSNAPSRSEGRDRAPHAASPFDVLQLPESTKRRVCRTGSNWLSNSIRRGACVTSSDDHVHNRLWKCLRSPAGAHHAALLHLYVVYPLTATCHQRLHQLF